MKDRLLSNPTLWRRIERENIKQINKWGCQDHSPFEWLAFTTEELGELSEAISEHFFREGNTEDVINEAIQTATLAIKIAEMYIHLNQV